MAWEHLSITKPHLAYMILGGFTSLFMLCSLFIKEKLYIGEASVATIVGVIFGPYAADIFNPLSWGNTDSITLECSRIVLVVQCFAVGVELPKNYMVKHWRSVTFLLIPVMTYGWLVTSLFIWWMVEPLSWLESLACAACVTATDPVLASSVVGKGKFAKRVPKHLRDVLSAESGCNDGMAFPFIYLSIYLIRYRPDGGKVTFHWICYTILYECIFGAVYGFMIGYIARHAIKQAEKRGLIDRESFLVFYFVLALFCAGSGSFLGMDDLLIGFSAGVGFSNDGWFSAKTEESHVSNVIDLLLNLAYFVYLGSIIPWDQYNSPAHGLVPWRLVVISLFVIFFRRIPIMMVLKPVIPDIKTWREALFAGHFGPIGVGAIFAAILARAELEDAPHTTPLAVMPDPGEVNYVLIYLIWPITTFMVVTSIIVHGSSIAVFTLGKRINMLTITMSYTQANDDGPAWMQRLPRISSQSKADLSFRTEDEEDTESTEKLPAYPPGAQPPLGMPTNFLRRQIEEDNPSRQGSRSSSLVSPIGKRRKSRWDTGMGPGGPISQSAIAPLRRPETTSSPDVTSPASPSGSDSLGEKTESPGRPEGESTNKPPGQGHRHAELDIEVFQEGNDLILEDEDGNVLRADHVAGMAGRRKQHKILDSGAALLGEKSENFPNGKHEQPPENDEGEGDAQVAKDAAGDGSGQGYKTLVKKLHGWNWGGGRHHDPGEAEPSEKHKSGRKRGPAHAYQFGNTVIVEDEDGEVIKKYTIPPAEKKQQDAAGRRVSGIDVGQTRRGLQMMGTWVGLNAPATKEGVAVPETAADADVEAQTPARTKKARDVDIESDDEDLRFTVRGEDRRMSKADFFRHLRTLDSNPQATNAVNDAAEDKDTAGRRPRAGSGSGSASGSGVRILTRAARSNSTAATSPPSRPSAPRSRTGPPRASSREEPPSSLKPAGLQPPREGSPTGSVGSHSSHGSGAPPVAPPVPELDISASLARFSNPNVESAAAARRRRLAEHYDEDGTPHAARSLSGANQGESIAERRRRLAALGSGDDHDSSDSEEDGRPRIKKGAVPGPPEPGATTSRAPERRVGVTFKDQRSPSALAEDNDSTNAASPSRPRIQWGGVTGRSKERRGLFGR